MSPSPGRRTCPLLAAVPLLIALPPLLAAQGSAPVPAPAPKLAVIVSVDGLSWPRLAQYRAWYVAGFKRLLEESWIEGEARYRHLNTETGPGHAALGTGAPPRVTGIMGNRWFETNPDGTIRSLSCVDQLMPDGKLVAGPGNLRVPTLGDRLVEVRPGARVVALSAKDRASIFLAGRNPRHAAYWFDQETGRFSTSAAYDPPAAARAIVERFNRRSAGPLLPARFGLFWKPLPPPEPPTVLPSPRPTPVPTRLLYDYQLPNNGLGWDHPLTVHPQGYFTSLYYSPFTDELVSELALAFIEDTSFGLGRGAQPDLLALSFSAQDLVSHSYGAESEENLDVLRRLDLHFGRLLEALERSYGKSNVALALSADHGFAVIPEAEHARNRDFKGGRLVYTDRTMPSFLERLNRALDDELCLPAGSRPLYGSDGWNIVYNRPELDKLRTVEGACGPAGRPVDATDVDRVFPKLASLLYREELQGVYLVSQADQWLAGDPVTAFVRNDFDKQRSGDVFLIPRPGVMTHWDPGRGSMHGSQYEYDTHVPLVFWGGPFTKGESKAEATPYDLAPTLAQLLGVPLKDAVGRSRLP